MKAMRVDAIDFVPAGTEVVGGITYNVFEKGNARLLTEVGVAVTVNNPPVIVSGATATVMENQTSAYTATATDPEGDAVTYSLSGTDAALFNIDSATGAVTFKVRPTSKRRLIAMVTTSTRSSSPPPTARTAPTRR